jgi:hypothetical protein
MVKNHSTHTWIGSFAERLVQLRPVLGIGSAVQYAVMSIHYAADIDPRRAAEIFVISNPMSDSIKQRRAEPPPAVSPAARYRNLFGARTAHAYAR